MVLPKQSTHQQQLKQRVFTLLNKLSDRDTHAIGATELDSIARCLPTESLSPFLTCIYDIDSSTPAPVRKQCVRLLTILSKSHRNALSPFLSKILSNILLPRLKDSQACIRSTCIDAVSMMSSQITDASFSVFLKPLMESILIDLDHNVQVGSALCLASAIEASPNPEPTQLQRLLPKLVKLLKTESFKAKSAMLSLIASVVVGSGGTASSSFSAAGGGKKVLRNLIGCMIEFLRSQDWTARKAAAEAFLKLAVMERDELSEFKSWCLASFETRRFDKVKIVRDIMYQMIEAWKNVPDELKPSSTDNASDGQFPNASTSSNNVSYESPQTKRITAPTRRSPPPSDRVMDRRLNPPHFCKLDRKKSADWKIEISAPRLSSASVNCLANLEDKGERFHDQSEESERNSWPKHEKECTKNSDEKMDRGLRAESTVVLVNESLGSTFLNNGDAEIYGNKESEDLSLIQKQLIHIENQQSNLLDLLQRFIGSSQSGIRALETRVNGLEMALNEISYDLAVTTRRMSITDSSENTCCKLPGADFLTS